MSDVSELPAWPEEGPAILSPLQFANAEAHAALARMEALVEIVRILRTDGLHDNPLDDSRMRRRIDALLAACEREEGR